MGKRHRDFGPTGWSRLTRRVGGLDLGLLLSALLGFASYGGSPWLAAAGAQETPGPPAPNAETGKLPWDRLELRFNGVPVANAEAPLSFTPGKINRLDIAPLQEAATSRWEVRVRKYLPSGELEEQTAWIGGSDGTSFLLGPMTAPPIYEFEAGEVYRRGYRLEIQMQKTPGKDRFRQSYHQGLAGGAMDYWHPRKEIAAGLGRLVPGEQERVVYNPGLGVEALLTLRLAERVLRDPDDVEVQIRLNPGAPVETLAGQLRITNANGELLEQQEIRLPPVGQWSSIPLEVRDWPSGDYRIVFAPRVEGRVWEEGPAVEYRRRAPPENRVSISPYAPWTLERDPNRPELKVSDFADVVDSWAIRLGSWNLQTNQGRAALSAPVGKPAEPLVLRPNLEGTYAVFARPYADGCLLQIGDDALIRSVRDGELVFLTAAEMTGREVKVFSFDPYSNSRGGLAELHFVPVTTESKEALYQETSAPAVPLYGVSDWAEYFWGHARLEPDQVVTILAGQAELGLRTIGWSIGRSWVEYESELPNADPFPTVPLEEAAKKFEQAPLYYGRTVMINEKRPLHHALTNRQRLGVEVWPWLGMNRHYGNQHGNMFSSQWFKENPQWRRWHKHASQPDASEVSYFFPEVRQERLDIFLEVAARGVDGLVVGACRQMPMLLYHPEMVAAYQKQTGIDPQQIDASDGQIYRDWITWRADHFTQLLRMLQVGLAELEQQQGREIRVAVRVPTVGLFYNLAQGLDVQQWCREGLVDQIQLVPLETCGGRGTHDIQQYVDLGRQYDVTMIGGIGATWMSSQGAVPAMHRALDLIETGVAGIEIYESEVLARTTTLRWLTPVFGNPARLQSMLRDSNLEACFPVTGNNAVLGFDNHSKWAIWGYSVNDEGPNSL